MGLKKNYALVIYVGLVRKMCEDFHKQRKKKTFVMSLKYDATENSWENWSEKDFKNNAIEEIIDCYNYIEKYGKKYNKEVNDILVDLKTLFIKIQSKK